jgi:site-specific DNA recombinase
LSFAQFEREIIAERTRDKMAATRRKGKWSGGMTVLGYDLDPRGRRLHVNEEEAERVRAIFALYLEHQAMLPVVQELARRGWVGKCWQTRHGRQRGGRPFTKTSLYRLLTNVLYAGQVRYKDEIHDGEQPALIDADTFARVQALLQSHGPEVGPPNRHRFPALLKGLLRCVACDCAMTPSHTTRKGGLRYRYYTCVQARKSGWQNCPAKSIPAQPIEQLVIEQIQRLGRDPLVLQEMLTTVRQEDEARVAEWEGERVGLERNLLRGQSEIRRLLVEVGSGTPSNAAVTRLAELQARLAHIEQRLARLRGQMEAWQQERLDQAAVTEVLSGLVPAWETMTPQEQRVPPGLRDLGAPACRNGSGMPLPDRRLGSGSWSVYRRGSHRSRRPYVTQPRWRLAPAHPSRLSLARFAWMVQARLGLHLSAFARLVTETLARVRNRPGHWSGQW